MAEYLTRIHETLGLILSNTKKEGKGKEGKEKKEKGRQEEQRVDRVA